MGAAGILRADERVELIRGVIVEMSPIGGPHVWVVKLAYDLLTERLSGRALTLCQSPIRLTDSEPQPDVLVLSIDASRRAVPDAKVTLLVVEIADSTLRADLTEKVPLYAENGIPEVWVIDVNRERVHVFRDPVEGTYRHTRLGERDDAFDVAAFPDVVLRPSDILGDHDVSPR